MSGQVGGKGPSFEDYDKFVSPEFKKGASLIDNLKTLKDMLAVKVNRLQNLISNREWINNRVVFDRLKGQIDDVTSNIAHYDTLISGVAGIQSTITQAEDLDEFEKQLKNQITSFERLLASLNIDQVSEAMKRFGAKVGDPKGTIEAALKNLGESRTRLGTNADRIWSELNQLIAEQKQQRKQIEASRIKPETHPEAEKQKSVAGSAWVAAKPSKRGEGGVAIGERKPIEESLVPQPPAEEPEKPALKERKVAPGGIPKLTHLTKGRVRKPKFTPASKIETGETKTADKPAEITKRESTFTPLLQKGSPALNRIQANAASIVAENPQVQQLVGGLKEGQTVEIKLSKEIYDQLFAGVRKQFLPQVTKSDFDQFVSDVAANPLVITKEDGDVVVRPKSLEKAIEEVVDAHSERKGFSAEIAKVGSTFAPLLKKGSPALKRIQANAASIVAENLEVRELVGGLKEGQTVEIKLSKEIYDQLFAGVRKQFLPQVTKSDFDQFVSDVAANPLVITKEEGEVVVRPKSLEKAIEEAVDAHSERKGFSAEMTSELRNKAKTLGEISAQKREAEIQAESTRLEAERAKDSQIQLFTAVKRFITEARKLGFVDAKGESTSRSNIPIQGDRVERLNAFMKADARELTLKDAVSDVKDVKSDIDSELARVGLASKAQKGGRTTITVMDKTLKLLYQQMNEVLENSVRHLEEEIRSEQPVEEVTFEEVTVETPKVDKYHKAQEEWEEDFQDAVSSVIQFKLNEVDTALEELSDAQKILDTEGISVILPGNALRQITQHILTKREALEELREGVHRGDPGSFGLITEGIHITPDEMTEVELADWSAKVDQDVGDLKKLTGRLLTLRTQITKYDEAVKKVETRIAELGKPETEGGAGNYQGSADLSSELYREGKWIKDEMEAIAKEGLHQGGIWQKLLHGGRDPVEMLIRTGKMLNASQSRLEEAAHAERDLWNLTDQLRKLERFRSGTPQYAAARKAVYDKIAHKAEEDLAKISKKKEEISSGDWSVSDPAHLSRQLDFDQSTKQVQALIGKQADTLDAASYSQLVDFSQKVGTAIGGMKEHLKAVKARLEEVKQVRAELEAFEQQVRTVEDYLKQKPGERLHFTERLDQAVKKTLEKISTLKEEAGSEKHLKQSPQEFAKYRASIQKEIAATGKADEPVIAEYLSVKREQERFDRMMGQMQKAIDEEITKIENGSPGRLVLRRFEKFMDSCRELEENFVAAHPGQLDSKGMAEYKKMIEQIAYDYDAKIYGAGLHRPFTPWAELRLDESNPEFLKPEDRNHLQEAIFRSDFEYLDGRLEQLAGRDASIDWKDSGGHPLFDESTRKRLHKAIEDKRLVLELQRDQMQEKLSDRPSEVHKLTRKQLEEWHKNIVEHSVAAEQTIAGANPIAYKEAIDRYNTAITGAKEEIQRLKDSEPSQVAAAHKLQSVLESETAEIMRKRKSLNAFTELTGLTEAVEKAAKALEEAAMPVKTETLEAQLKVLKHGSREYAQIHNELVKEQHRKIELLELKINGFIQFEKDIEVHDEIIAAYERDFASLRKTLSDLKLHHTAYPTNEGGTTELVDVADLSLEQLADYKSEVADILGKVEKEFARITNYDQWLDKVKQVQSPQAGANRAIVAELGNHIEGTLKVIRRNGRFLVGKIAKEEPLFTDASLKALRGYVNLKMRALEKMKTPPKQPFEMTAGEMEAWGKAVERAEKEAVRSVASLWLIRTRKHIKDFNAKAAEVEAKIKELKESKPPQEAAALELQKVLDAQKKAVEKGGAHLKNPPEVQDFDNLLEEATAKLVSGLSKVRTDTLDKQLRSLTEGTPEFARIHSEIVSEQLRAVEDFEERVKGKVAAMKEGMDEVFVGMVDNAMQKSREGVLKSLGSLKEHFITPSETPYYDYEDKIELDNLDQRQLMAWKAEVKARLREAEKTFEQVLPDKMEFLEKQLKVVKKGSVEYEYVLGRLVSAELDKIAECGFRFDQVLTELEGIQQPADKLTAIKKQLEEHKEALEALKEGYLEENYIVGTRHQHYPLKDLSASQFEAYRKEVADVMKEAEKALEDGKRKLALIKSEQSKDV